MVTKILFVTNSPVRDCIDETVFQTNVENVAFANRFTSSKYINNFVQMMTDNTIENVIDSRDLNNPSTALLVNAAFFSGSWEATFTTNTEDTEFFVKPDQSVKVRMMNIKHDFHVGDDYKLNCSAVKISYTQGYLRH